jgi:D-3-phosphoglycerate dehydrogenase
MTQTPTLEILSFTGIGASNFIDLPAAAAQGITVCNCPGYADNTVAEHTLALLLAAARHVPRLDAELRDGHWNQSLDGMELREKQLGLVGFGGIGRRVFELARAFGMTVKVWTRNPSEARAREHDVEFVSLDKLLQTSDVISLHVALTDDTQGLINAGRIKQMKPGAILINTARGEIVDEAALVDALKERHLKAAGLDVYQQDPLPVEHPLLKLDNVVLSPHVAYNTPEAGDAIYEIAVENIVKYYEGNPINIVASPRQE